MRRILLIAVASALAAAAPAQAGPDAAAAKSCAPPEYPGNGYFTSLRVSGASCGRGRKVARAHHRCRTRSGVRGKCRRKVLRYRCRERRVTIPTEFNGRVTCRRASRRVVFTYQQNT